MAMAMDVPAVGGLRTQEMVFAEKEAIAKSALIAAVTAIRLA